MSSAVPQHCPAPRELDDLELLLSGAVPGDPLLDLELPDELAEVSELELVDPEGLPLARATRAEGGWALHQLTRPQYGPFRRLYLTPAETRERYSGRTVVPVTGPVTDVQLDQLADLGPTLLLAFVGHGTPELSPVALLRATHRVAESLPDAVVVAAPLAARGDADLDHELGVTVALSYAGDDPVLGLIDGGEVLPDLDDIIDADRPPPDRQGLVLFFTGLSGSGKSTIARALVDRLLEQGHRTVTSLDGDVVRRHLSAGLTFSREDRETNIRRIGWVAAEIARHGGVAVCSPIAPFDETRQQVRTMTDEAGGAFFLVHVATPLEECERRDRKGLYAKARRGEIPEFTGISSPYEEPDDADVRVDTTGRSVEEALADVVAGLRDAGYLDLDPAADGARTLVEPVETPEPIPPTGAKHVGGTTSGRLDKLDERDPERLDKLDERHEPLRVLFVCTANICRSPFMELTARQLAGDAPLEITSAGTRGFHDQPVDPPMAEVLTSRGIDHDAFRSKALRPEHVVAADLVITAETAHRSYILDDNPGAFRKVFTIGQLARALEPLDTGMPLLELLRSLGERRGTASADLDVTDPYGRGRAAAEECANRMDTLLRGVVPRLAESARMRGVGVDT